MENSTLFMYTESFTRAGPRKKRKHRPFPPQPLEQLERTKQELASNGWLSECQDIIQSVLRELSFVPAEVICLGLGSPASSRDARAQLAFLIKLCSLFDIDHTKVSVYDPVFTDVDITILETLGMHCIAENRNAMYPVTRPNIVYMPHCDMSLYENIMRENWSREQLTNIVFIANQFGDYIDNNPWSKLETISPCLLRLAPLVDSRPLPTSRSHTTAFNNISVQHVRRLSLPLDNDMYWHKSPSSSGIYT